MSARLPIHHTGVSKNPRPAVISKQEDKSRRRILVVEDDVDSARSLTWILRDMGHEVQYAINGYVALDMAKHLRPEFVFLDLMLPGMNGFDVCRRLKREAGLEATRVIIVTAFGQAEYRARSQEAGCDDYIVKPLAPAMLETLLA